MPKSKSKSKTKSKSAKRGPVQGSKIDLLKVASRAVDRAVKRGVNNLDDLYIAAERGAKRTLTRAYNAMTPRMIDNHTAAGRRAVSRAANIQRSNNGILHQHLTAAVLARVTSIDAAPHTKGDILVNGELVECKRSLRERQRQIFADNTHVKTVVIRSVDGYDAKRKNFQYLRKHGAAVVMPHGDTGVLSLTEYAARVLHKKVATVKAA